MYIISDISTNQPTTNNTDEIKGYFDPDHKNTRVKYRYKSLVKLLFIAVKIMHYYIL